MTKTGYFSAPAGMDEAKLFALNTDTVVANGTSTSVTAGTNDNTFYTVVWSASLANGTYRLVLYDGGVALAGLAQVVVGASTVTEATSGGSGTGARTVTITVTLNTGGSVEGATVRMTKAAESYTAATNASGVCTFNVDDGTWTVAITAAGASFSGASLVVDGNESASYQMTATSLTPSDPGKRTGYYTCFDEDGVLEAGVVVTCWAVSPPSTTGVALDSRERTETSGANGVVEFTNMIVGARYKFKRGDWDKSVTVDVPSGAGAFALDSLVGRETA
jgi:hypothetical protein